MERFGNRYQAANLSRIPWLDHGFGTRHAGNWVDGQPGATLRQIHSAIVWRVTESSGCLGEGDSLITNRPGIWLSVRTADCVPVIVADQVRQAIGVAHAGWRGVANGVIDRTLERMQFHFGTAVGDLQIAIGPGIGLCCFEVGPEVARQFQKIFPERADLHGKTCLDLTESLMRRMRKMGIAESQMEYGAPCTRCTPDEFHSYRRDGSAAGRMVSAASIRHTQ